MRTLVASIPSTGQRALPRLEWTAPHCPPEVPPRLENDSIRVHLFARHLSALLPRSAR